jgi:hypothetical protein
LRIVFGTVPDIFPDMDAKIFLLGMCFLTAFCGCLDGPGSDPPNPSVKGGMPENEYADLTLAGANLGQYDGKHVLIRIGGPEPLFYPRERTGAGSARISQGSFRIHFPSVREVGLYKWFVLFIDTDGDGRCAAGKDVGFMNATGGGGDPYVYAVEPWQIFPVEQADCDFFHAAWME